MAEKNLGDLKAKFKVDVVQMEKLVTGITTIRKDFDALNTSLGKVNEKLSKTLRLLQGIQQAGGVKGVGGAPTSNPAAGGVNLLPHVTNMKQVNIYNAAAPATAAAAEGGAGAAAKANPYAAAAYLGGQAIASTIQAMNARMDNNLARSSSVDKLGV